MTEEQKQAEVIIKMQEKIDQLKAENKKLKEKGYS